MHYRDVFPWFVQIPGPIILAKWENDEELIFFIIKRFKKLVISTCSNLIISHERKMELLHWFGNDFQLGTRKIK